MTQLLFDYWLTGDGFCQAFFRIGDAQLDLHQLGDSPDPLEELMTAALALARSVEPPEVFMDPEDGGLYQWYIRREQGRLHLRVTYVDASNDGRRGPAPDVPAFAAECSVHEFCSVIADRAAQVIEHYGPDRYRQLWLAPFPFQLLNALQAAVAQLPT